MLPEARVLERVPQRAREHLSWLCPPRFQRKAELEVVHGDDLLAQSEAIDRDLRAMLGEAKQAHSLGACLQVIDRMQRQLALRAQLQERAAVASEGHVRYEVGWIDSCPRHPHDCGCPPEAAETSFSTHKAPAAGTGTPDPKTTQLN